jgi:hypothetical protein
MTDPLLIPAQQVATLTGLGLSTPLDPLEQAIAFAIRRAQLRREREAKMRQDRSKPAA